MTPGPARRRRWRGFRGRWRGTLALALGRRMRGSRTIRTAQKRAAFLQRLAEGSSIPAAAAAIDVGRQSVYDWRGDDVAFAAAWDEAIESGTDKLEDEARRRALDALTYC